MNHLKNFSLPVILAFLLGFGIPLHGAISVFLPDGFRWWKELFIAYFTIAGVFRFFTANGNNIKAAGFPVLCAVALLSWGGIRFLLEPSLGTYGLIALRFLLFGYGVFIVFSLLRSHPKAPSIRKFFSAGLIIGALVSLLFGVWAHHMGGYQVLADFYSTTISSWVPGQTLPLYHEADGIARMQGMSSGPVAFAHILLAALMAMRFLSIKPASRVVLWTLFTVGIWESQSRAALLLLILLVLWQISVYLIVNRSVNFVRFIAFTGSVGVSLVIALLFTDLPGRFLERAGTSDHFTRPVEAFQVGLESPLLGQLSQIGPAARIRNLAEINNDQALLAENLFADIFAQLGVFGLMLVITFWGLAIRYAVSRHRIVALVALGGGMMASLYDMIPVAIAMFVLLAFIGRKWNNDQVKNTEI